MRFALILLAVALPAGAATKADLVVVDKSERVLYLFSNGQAFRRFHIALGGNPVGHKQREGDHRTPEGAYVLDLKNDESAFYRSIRVSYPNAYDKARALRRGDDPGGEIMIHGQKETGWLQPVAARYDWTDGCIAVTNAEMDEIWQAVDIGVPIQINP